MECKRRKAEAEMALSQHLKKLEVTQERDAFEEADSGFSWVAAVILLLAIGLYLSIGSTKHSTGGVPVTVVSNSIH
ncbi:MAG: hypothetical protein J0H02_18355 [Armatimonadetes bacterium]|nr:hypothetical protein [Armatimonadota bacterium]